MTTANSYHSVPSQNHGGQLFATTTHHVDEAANSLSPARIRADELLRQASTITWQRPEMGVIWLHRLLDVGRILQQAKELLGETDFVRSFDADHEINFSYFSAQRYMRLARHADAILAAGLTRVRDADRLAQDLDYAMSKVVNGRATTPATPTLTPTTPLATTLANENEKRIFNDVRRLPAANQPVFMADLVGRLTHLQSLFA